MKKGKGRGSGIPSVPEDEGDLVPLTAVNLELVVEDGVAAIPLGQLGPEVVVRGGGTTDLVNNHLGVVVVHLEGHIAVGMAELELIELGDAVIGDSNAGHRE